MSLDSSKARTKFARPPEMKTVDLSLWLVVRPLEISVEAKSLPFIASNASIHSLNFSA